MTAVRFIASAARQRKFVAAILAVSLIVAIAFLIGRLLQPHYHGKSIGAWFYRFDDPDSQQAPEAFRAMGQRAIPFLVRRLERPPNKVIYQVLSIVMTPTGERYRQYHNMWQCRAAFFLGELGPAAEAAEAKLVAATSSQNWSMRGSAEVALMKIRPAPISPLIERLRDISDFTRWYEIAMKVAEFGVRAKSAVPILLESLSHTNNIIQAHALIALGAIGCEPEKCIPAIVPFLVSPSVSDRQKAIGALLGFGTSALPARAAIQKALNDSDPWVRMEAKRAIAVLDQGKYHIDR